MYVQFGDAFLGAILGGLVTLVITIVIELERNAALRLTAIKTTLLPHERFGKTWASLRIRVENATPRPWAKFLTRSAAEACRASINFCRQDGSFLFGPMTGRWVESPEPHLLTYPARDGTTVQTLAVPDNYSGTMNIYAGDGELLDVAIRVEGEREAYGWNDEAYRVANSRNPKFQFDPGCYLVAVTIRSSGRTVTDWFRLENDGPFSAFRLSDTSSVEKRKLRSATSIPEISP
jgi:hypothetical protein